MPRYQWVGRDAAQQPVGGVLDGGSPAQVAEVLAQRGVVPLAIDLHTPPAPAGEVIGRWLGRDRIGDETLMMFSRQMHTLMRAGVPLLRALDGLAQSSSHAGFVKLMRQLRAELDAGTDLSGALAKRPDVFGDFYVAMVRVGEHSGQLAEVFVALFQHLEFQKTMRDQVKAALRYPQFVVLAMVAALVVVNVFVIPAFAKVFASFKAELPLMTRLLLGMSQFMLAHWPAMLALAVGLLVAWRTWVRSEAGRFTWDRLKLRLPVAGPLLHRAALARACRGLARSLGAGVPLVHALTLAADVVDNVYVGSRLREMRTGVERGESVLATAGKAGIFTPLVLQMVMVGEESGTLDEMLEEIGQMYQRDVEHDLKTMGQQIEPILIFVLGAMVLVLALGVFLPMWELGQAAFKH